MPTKALACSRLRIWKYGLVKRSLGAETTALVTDLNEIDRNSSLENAAFDESSWVR
jgi:hypothetical protein